MNYEDSVEVICPRCKHKWVEHIEGEFEPPEPSMNEGHL